MMNTILRAATLALGVSGVSFDAHAASGAAFQQRNTIEDGGLDQAELGR